MTMASDAEAAVIEAACDYLEAIGDHPNTWAGDAEMALVIAVQDLTGDTRWPEIRGGEAS